MTRTRKGALRAVVGTVALVVAAVTCVLAAPAAQAAACTVSYSYNLWGIDADGDPTMVYDDEGDLVPTGQPQVATRVISEITLTNTGGYSTKPWTAAWTGPAHMEITGIWNATLTRVAYPGNVTMVAVTGQTWNGTLNDGSSVSYGYLGTIPGAGVVNPVSLIHGFSMSVESCTVLWPGES